jgi:hypothetical protein
MSLKANRKTTVYESHLLASLQLLVGLGLLAVAGWFHLLDRMGSPTHFIGPRFFAVLLTPPSVGLLVSGLALRFRWPGSQVLQLAPWLAVVFTLAWFRSLRGAP